MTFLQEPLPYPLRVEDEREAIERLAIDVALVRHVLTKEYGLGRLEELLIDGLRDGQLSPRRRLRPRIGAIGSPTAPCVRSARSSKWPCCKSAIWRLGICR